MPQFGHLGQDRRFSGAREQVAVDRPELEPQFACRGQRPNLAVQCRVDVPDAEERIVSYGLQEVCREPRHRMPPEVPPRQRARRDHFGLLGVARGAKVLSKVLAVPKGGQVRSLHHEAASSTAVVLPGKRLFPRQLGQLVEDDLPPWRCPVLGTPQHALGLRPRARGGTPGRRGGSLCEVHINPPPFGFAHVLERHLWHGGWQQPLRYVVVPHHKLQLGWHFFVGRARRERL
mmetsp:Transcript_26742/g.80236  ORF Transcript_26742/g.80236 Transcript_26742/m.80236 type:complete len:232 (+) Transcript_26742:358-1053(+)